MKKITPTAEMQTMTACLNKLVMDGYTEDFKVTEKGLLSIQKEKHYKADQVEITDFYRFEGASDPSDNSIVYAIETNDGTKGTLTDAYGPYADPVIGKFIKQVEEITKKPTTK